MERNLEAKEVKKHRFVIEVSGPEDSLPGDDDTWFWGTGDDIEDTIDELLPIFAPHLVKPAPDEPKKPNTSAGK